ncbi:glycosyltransferase family 1 protein [soil metagenome]
MKICDLTQFYSPRSGGVKRYVHEKIAHLQSASPDDEHVLVVPGAATGVTVNGRSRIYTIRSPLISRTTQYRVLLDLRAVTEIIERERPDIIESGDPYQVGWAALRAGRLFHIPVVAFYHSHFAEAHTRSLPVLAPAARAYVRAHYNHYAATLVPSPRLAQVLLTWGVRNVRPVSLGVNTEVFHPQGAKAPRPAGARTLLLYVGRLAREKNTATLLEAFSLLDEEYHLLVIGDGLQRERLRELIATGRVTWLPYCSDPVELAGYYRAADLLVHPGVEETFGLVAVESQACGTPVVGIRGSYLDDAILHDQSTWAEENSAWALANAIERTGAADLPSLGKVAAAQVRERFGWPRVFAQLLCIYREVRANYSRTTLR